MFVKNCFFLAFCLVSLSLTTAYGVYREIYPPLAENASISSQDYYNRRCTVEEPCPLFFTFLISFGGIYKSNGGLPGVQIALNQINADPDFLPGYTLHYTLHDSNVSTHTEELIRDMQMNICTGDSDRKTQRRRQESWKPGDR